MAASSSATVAFPSLFSPPPSVTMILPSNRFEISQLTKSSQLPYTKVNKHRPLEYTPLYFPPNCAHLSLEITQWIWQQEQRPHWVVELSADHLYLLWC